MIKRDVFSDVDYMSDSFVQQKLFIFSITFISCFILKNLLRKENRDLEEVMRGWFRRNQSKHGLKPKEIEIVIGKILELDGKFR